MNRWSRLVDTARSFGWISIALHWTAAIAVVAMWFIGQSIYSQVSLDDTYATRTLHITVGMSSWALLAGRILWRLLNGHPRVAGQTLLTHRIARFTHYLMLGLLGLLMITGPIMAWLNDLLDLSVVSLLRAVHQYAANGLLSLVALHILASFKHLMFHEDETIVRMFIPKS